jgi:regulator of protease activity HflC (stomatin/prohibitin superfamily)
VVALLVVLIVVGFLLVFFVLSGLRVVQEYERAVIFYLGRCQGAKGPGLFYVPPLISRIVKVNLQTQAVPVASQQVITKDNVTVAVDAVAYFRVRDPVASVIKIQNWYNAAQLVAQTSLRSIIGRHELDQPGRDPRRVSPQHRRRERGRLGPLSRRFLFGGRPA